MGFNCKNYQINIYICCKCVFCNNFVKNTRYLKQFVHRKIKWKNNFIYSLTIYWTVSCTIKITPWIATFITAHEPFSTYYQPTSIVYIRDHSKYCKSCGFQQMSNDMYLHFSFSMMIKFKVGLLRAEVTNDFHISKSNCISVLTQRS